MRTKVLALVALSIFLGTSLAPAADEAGFDWKLLGLGAASGDDSPALLIESSQEYGELTLDASCHTHTPLQIGERKYPTGLGSHAKSKLVFRLQRPFRSFVADVGVDNNSDTRREPTKASVRFLVQGDGRELAQTPICHVGDAPRHLEVSVEKVSRLELLIDDGGDGISFDQADWADARLIDAEGKSWPLGDLIRDRHVCPFLRQASLPASFVYGGKPSAALLPTWTRTELPVRENEQSRVFEIAWREPNGPLLATWHVEVFKDRPAAEFRWLFQQTGSEPTQAITEVYALDLRAPGMTQAKLVHSNGGLTGPFTGELAAFLVAESPLSKPITLAAAGGRSSNKDLPFFVLHDTTWQGGIYVGLGWSGQWQADFRPAEAQSKDLRITAGMPGTDLRLSGGTKVRSPSVLLGSYRGDAQAGSNALRRTLYDHYVARLGNEKPLPPVSWNHWFTFTNNVSEAMLKVQVDAAADLGLEYFCIDSGWFIGDFPNGVGNWTIDTKKFPQGLGPIGKYVAEKGMKLGLWFEIGRADPGTRLVREHPEWVSGNQVKLELPEARQWLFEMMCQFIDEGNVRWIRYDYNFDPLQEWDRCDRPETRGLTQIQYLEGEYELFDRLRERYPDLLIESCASGGRRIDLETIRRAHTFWKSDETSNLLAARGQETGGNRFLPGGLLNTNLPATSRATNFDLHCLFGGPLGFATDWTRLDAAGKDRVRQAITDYKRVRHLLNKDYYALLPQSFEAVHWVAWEFLDPEQGEGLVVVLRPAESAYGSVDLRLRGLEADRTYRLPRLDGSEAREVTGRELQAKLNVALGPGESQVLHLTRP